MKLDNTFAKWEKTRTKGLLRFVIFAGLYFGVGFSILFSFFIFTIGKLLSQRKSEIFFETEFFIFFIAVSLASGFLWSTIIWYLSEAKYQKYIINKNLSNDSD